MFLVKRERLLDITEGHVQWNTGKVVIGLSQKRL